MRIRHRFTEPSSFLHPGVRGSRWSPSMVVSTLCASLAGKATSSFLAERAKTTEYSSMGLTLRLLQLLLDRLKGFTRFCLPFSRECQIEKFLPEFAILLEVDQDSGLDPLFVNQELDAFHESSPGQSVRVPAPRL